MTVSRQVQANRRRAALVLGAFVGVVTVLLAVVLLLLGAGLFGLLVALAVAGGVAGVLWSRAEAAVLSLVGAAPADPVGHARLFNLVEGLCAAAGLPTPAVHVLDDQNPNCLTAGRDARRAVLVVTSGLLDELNRIELEGVLAHELSHLRNGDALVSTLAVVFVALPLRPLPSLAARAVAATVGTEREPWADVAGAALTRYPPGLAAALEKVQDTQDRAAGARAPGSTAHPALAHLWLVEPPAASRRPSGRARTHPPLAQRIEILREL